MMSSFRTTELSNPLFESNGLRFITVKSTHLKGRGDICTYIPNNTTATNLPIVILLHGVYGSVWSWELNGGAHQLAQSLINDKMIKPMILVMPSDGLWGDGSAYMKHSGRDYERWIVEEVITAVRELIPQAKNTKQCFISGLSMGGFGALRLGSKYSHIFDAISGHSSITNLSQMELFVEEDLYLYEQENPIDHSVLKTILRYIDQLPPLRFDCGKEDLLLEHNRSLSNSLRAYNIPHTYEEFNGKHEWTYWQKHLKDSLLFFDKYI